MERSNLRSVSIFIIILSILLIGLVSVEVMADPEQEQEECTDSRAPNVNVGGEAIILDLPAGPLLKVEGTDVGLTVLGQTLSGNFVFEQSTSPRISPSPSPPPILPVTPHGQSSGGQVVPIRGDDSSPSRTFVPGARVFFGSREACAGVLGDGQADGVDLDLPDGPYLRVKGTGIQLEIAGQTLSGDFAFEQITTPGTHGITSKLLHGGTGNDRFLRKNFQRTSGIPGRGTGSMYINTAYGTTRADVPVCYLNATPTSQSANGYRPGRHMLGNPFARPVYWQNIYSLGADYGPDDGSDMAIRLGLSELGPLGVFVNDSAQSSSKGSGAIIPVLNLHYDSGKADGSIAQRQTVLGYGWTHNYNIYLIDKSPDIFIADGKGRMTRLQDDGLGGYIPSDGQTHTLTQFDPNTYLLEEVDGSTMAFQLADPIPAWAGVDNIYLLAGIQDAGGRVIELSYDGSSLLETITDPYGRQIQLGYSDYSGKKLLDSITDPNMQVTSIDCNDGNDLWRITDPEGYSLSYGYDPNHRLTSVTLKDGNTWSCDYSGGKPWRIIDPNSDIYVTVVNSEDWIPDACHPDGNEIRYKPSQTVITNGEGDITIFDLDENGYVTTLGHPNHLNETFVFDSNLRLTEIIDQENNHWLYTYDANGNLTDVNDPLNNHTKMFYEHPIIPSLCTGIIEPDSDMWEYEWDLQGNLLQITDPIVESPNDKVITYSYTYHPGPPYGRFDLVTATDRNGNSRECQFDPNGNIVQTVIDPCGLELTTDYEHDELGRVTKATVYRQAGSPNSVVTEYTYDSMGRLTKSVLDPNPLYIMTQYRYDEVGRLEEIANPRGIITKYKYDYRSRLMNRTFDTLGQALSTGYSYDSSNRLTKTVDPKGNQTNYSYDELNRLTKIVDDEGYWTEYEYDELSNLTFTNRSIDPGIPLYRSVKYVYDKLNRLTQAITDPCDLSLTTEFQYTPAGGVLDLGTPGTSLVHKITDAEGKIAYCYYDKLDRLTSVVGKVGDANDNGGDPNDAVIDYEYDSVSNRIGTVVQNAPHPNLLATYSFDAANRVIREVFDPCDANLVTTYTYDGTDSLIQRLTPLGNAIIYTYDKANRLIDVNDSIGAVANYTYDKNGNMLTETDGLGNTWRYSYDNADRLADACDPLVEGPSDKFTSYEYDKNGNLVKKTDNEGLVTDYEYDGLNRLISKSKDPCGLNIINTLAYDGLGNIVQATDDNNNATIYQYDGVNRLIRIEYADSTEEFFSYDSFGKLIDANDRMGNSTTYSYDDLHRMIQRTYADSNSDTFTYDRTGQMLSADNSHSHIGYIYDGVGRTLSTTQTDLPPTYTYTVTYAYTTEPNYTRTITYPDGNDVNEIYDVRNRLAQVEHNGSTVVQYTYQNPSPGTKTTRSPD
ncbi:MAG: RHS repeat domain-containing protein [Planctomycetota bacterium]